MRSVKHRKHKKNNSLKGYKKKQNNKKNLTKNTKMMGGVNTDDNTIKNPLLGDKYEDIPSAPAENDDSTINPLLMNNMPVNVEKITENPTPTNIEDINVIMNDTSTVNKKDDSYENQNPKPLELEKERGSLSLDENMENNQNLIEYISEIWKNISKNCLEIQGQEKCNILQKMNYEETPIKLLMSLNDNLTNLFESTKTQIKELKKEKTDSDNKIQEVLLEKEKIESENSGLTETRNKEIQSKTEEKDQLNNQIINLTTDIQNITKERDALQTEIMTNELMNQNNIVVSLDKETFYKDICKNIKNIIINSHFLDMLFDELLKAYPKPNIQETKATQLSPVNKERQLKITGMKSKIASARDFLYTFLQDLVEKLNVDSGVFTGVQPIDDITRTALGSNMAAYLFAASFFPLIGGKSNKQSKTIKSLGLHNKKQNKSLKSMSMIMKGGIDTQDKPKLEDLITKVIADICQQMQLTENLLKYIPNASIDMNSFNLSLIEFNSLFQERKGYDKKEIEPLTNFLVPYKESRTDNEYINQIKKDIELFLRDRQEKGQQTGSKLEMI